MNISENIKSLKHLRMELASLEGETPAYRQVKEKDIQAEIDSCLAEVYAELPLPIDVPLTENNGNALVIVGLVDKAMRRYGCDQEMRDEFRCDAMSDDYDHLLQTAMKWVEVS